VLTLPCAAVSPLPIETLATGLKERLLQVDIDQQQLDETVLVLVDGAGTFYLAQQDILRWRFKMPDGATGVGYLGDTYYPLDALADVSHVYEPITLRLMIKVRADAFVPTLRNSPSDAIPFPIPPSLGGFVNYDLFATQTIDLTQRSGQFEFGLFNRWGVGTSNFLANQVASPRDSQTQVTRLDSTWTMDFPERLQTLRLGDAVLNPGTWGRSVRFGGVQFGTNFGTQPSFISSPMQSVVGQAVLPSTVDVFINNALVSRQSVPPGPFSIRNLPVVTGAGNVQLVVRDLFGREQVITRPFYANPTLLRQGLDNYSYDLGWVREGFGLESQHYGDWIGAGTYRRGLTERLTSEFHAEAMPNQVTAGAGGIYLVPTVGTVSAYVASSHSALGQGQLTLLGFDRLAHPWSVGARAQQTSSRFTQVGGQPAGGDGSGVMSPSQISSINASYAANQGGSIGAAYVEQRNRNQDDLRIATVSYSLSLGQIGSFSLSVLRNFSGVANTTIFAMLSFPLGPSVTATISAQAIRGGRKQSQQDDVFTTSVQRNLPMGEGYGYRLQTSSDNAQEARIALQNNVGTYQLEAAQRQGEVASRLGVTGGLALMGGDIFASRRIDQSFAVARIPDYPGVHVLADNQIAGKTDSAGNALIPRLRAYDRNVISLDQRDLPLDAEIGTLKLTAVPYFRSGVELLFPIRHARSATLTLRQENGQPLPAGALVQIEGDTTMSNYTVGYDGQVYILGLGPLNHLRASWGSGVTAQACELSVPFVASGDPLPDLGVFMCKGVSP
jgi:outer membrane usher protein